MEKILSKKNERVKQWKKLLTKKGRTAAGAYLIEGSHMVEEAIKHQAPVREYILSETIAQEGKNKYPHDKLYIVSKEIAQTISETGTNQGFFAVVEIKEPTKPETPEKPYLLLDQVQDPGNVGTMIRTADAAGFAGVILGSGTVDLYNSKVLRSTQGSHFHFPVFQNDLGEWFDWFKDEHVPVYGTELNKDAASYREIPAASRFALVMGNEGNGMNRKWLERTDKNLYIPIEGNAESLNVAVAAGILMFALYQQN